MIVLGFSIFVIIILYAATKVLIKDTGIRLLHFVGIGLLIYPSTRMFGFGVSNPINLPFPFVFSLILMPIMFFKHKGRFLKKDLFMPYMRKIGKYFLFLITAVLLQSLYRYVKIGEPFVSGFFGLSYLFLTIFMLSYFFFCILSKIELEDRIQFINRFFTTAIVVTGLLGGAFYINFGPAIEFQQVFFEFKFTDLFDKEFSMVEQSITDNRSFAIFSASNQYGLFSTIGVVVILLLRIHKKISVLKFGILFALCCIIVISSQSRTALFLFGMALFFVIYNATTQKNKLLIIPLVILLIPVFMQFLPQRISDTLESDAFLVLLQQQRFRFWQSFFDNVFNLEFVVAGLYNQMLVDGLMQFFESGYLNVIARYGLVVFVLYVYILSGPFKESKKTLKAEVSKDNILYNRITVYCLGILLIAELFQGSVMTIRFDLIVGLLIAMGLTSQISALPKQAEIQS